VPSDIVLERDPLAACSRGGSLVDHHVVVRQERRCHPVCGEDEPLPGAPEDLGHRRLHHEQKQRDHAGPDPPPIVRASGPRRIAGRRPRRIHDLDDVVGEQQRDRQREVERRPLRRQHRPDGQRPEADGAQKPEKRSPNIAAIRLTETGNKDAEQHGDADAAVVRFGHRPP